MKTAVKIQLSCAFLALLIFILITFGVVVDSTWLAHFDTWGFSLVREPLSPNRTWFFKNVTRAGNEKWSLVLMFTLAILFIFQKKLRATCFLLINVGVFGYVFANLFKYLIHRPRPHIVHLVQASGFSFPSGHTMNAVLLYGSLIILANYYLANDGLRFAVNSFLGVIIVALPLSRIYLGVHYPSDVVAGYCLGYAMLVFSNFFIFKFNQLKRS